VRAATFTSSPQKNFVAVVGKRRDKRGKGENRRNRVQKTEVLIMMHLERYKWGKV
jgi:hypothetical protein